MTEMAVAADTRLAIDGGPKTRTEPWPGRAILGPAEKAAVSALFDAAIVSGDAFGYHGPEEEAYCREFAEQLGGGYADGVSSGTTALYVALKALELEPFTEVIVGAVTDPGGMMPVPLLNLAPIVADAAPGCYNTGPAEVEPLLSPLTSAIVVPHIVGEPADIEGIVALAGERGIPVIEDCAQSHGAELNGRRLGTFGEIGVFSTMFGKHYCTGGQGGMLFTKDEMRYHRIRRAADRGKPFGLGQDSTNVTAALNCNLDELGAAIGRVQLRRLPEFVQRRRALVAALTDGLMALPCIGIPDQLPGANPSYSFLRLRLNTDTLTCDKPAFCAALAAEGILVLPEYRALPHTFDWFVKRRVFGSSGLPWSAPQYKGDPARTFPCPNAHETIATHFNLILRESWGEREVRDVLAAFRKVAGAYGTQKRFARESGE